MTEADADRAALPQPEPELREQLAALAHEQWSGWMRYLFSKCSPLHEGPLRMPDEWAARWKQQVETPYAALSEAEKDSDRKEADRVLAALAGRLRAVQEENDRLDAQAQTYYTRLKDAESGAVYKDLAFQRARADKWVAVAERQGVELADLREVAKESNAVCICGCPVGEHDNYGEDGEACEHDDHECLRTSKAVYAVIVRLRAENRTLEVMLPPLHAKIAELKTELARLRAVEAQQEEFKDALIAAYWKANENWSAQCFCFTSAPESLRRNAHEAARDGYNEIVHLLGPIVRPWLTEEYWAAEKAAKALLPAAGGIPAPQPENAFPSMAEVWDQYERAVYGKVGNTFERQEAARIQGFFDWLIRRVSYGPPSSASPAPQEPTP